MAGEDPLEEAVTGFRVGLLAAHKLGETTTVVHLGSG